MGVKTAEIRHATADEIPAIVAFTRMARTNIFPMIDEPSHERNAAKELSTFSQTYLDSPDGAFFVAQADGVFVGSIAYAFYDYRFPHLHLGPERTVEVVRLYVAPAWRRTGLASKLFGALKQHACQAGVQRFYLHTHPFLPGATDFWERQGFSVMHVDDDPVWRTIHMELPIAEGVGRTLPPSSS